MGRYGDGNDDGPFTVEEIGEVIDELGCRDARGERAYLSYPMAKQLFDRATELDGLPKWVEKQWDQQVKSRPMKNAHRKILDNVWRQVYGKLTGKELPKPCAYPRMSLPPVGESEG